MRNALPLKPSCSLSALSELLVFPVFVRSCLRVGFCGCPVWDSLGFLSLLPYLGNGQWSTCPTVSVHSVLAPTHCLFSLRSFLLVLSTRSDFQRRLDTPGWGLRGPGTLAFCPSGLSLQHSGGGVTPCSRVCNRQSGIYQSKRTATVVYIAPVDFPGCTKVIFQTLQPQTPTSVSPPAQSETPPADHSCRTRGTGQATAPPPLISWPPFLRTVNMCSSNSAERSVTSVIPVNCILGMFWNRWGVASTEAGAEALPTAGPGRWTLGPCLRARWLGGAGEPPAWPLLTPL